MDARTAVIQSLRMWWTPKICEHAWVFSKPCQRLKCKCSGAVLTTVWMWLIHLKLTHFLSVLLMWIGVYLPLNLSTNISFVSLKIWTSWEMLSEHLIYEISSIGNRGGLSMQPWGAPVLRLGEDNHLWPPVTICGHPVKKSRIQLHKRMYWSRTFSFLGIIMLFQDHGARKIRHLSIFTTL